LAAFQSRVGYMAGRTEGYDALFENRIIDFDIMWKKD
jgi:hypothetical protein